MRLFYTPDIETNPELPAEEAAHCVKVLRLQSGDRITLTDGKGHFFEAEIEEASKCRVSVSLLNRTDWQKYWVGRIHLAVAPTKNLDRMEWLTEKITEIGLDEFSFLNCQYSERKILKLERIRKILVSAMKQSLKATLPVLNEMQDFKTFVKTARAGSKYIAHCQEGEKPFWPEVLKKGENITLLIGPEGDFSPEEVELALREGYKAISLGNSRLRTETAALTGVVVANMCNQ